MILSSLSFERFSELVFILPRNPKPRSGSRVCSSYPDVSKVVGDLEEQIILEDEETSMNILSNYRIRCNGSSLEIWKRKHTHLRKKSGRLLLLQTQEMINGVMKRHGYSGMPASHGASLSHRSGGSTGQRDAPGKVFKGKKMPGRMGGEQRTVQNVWLYKIDPKRNLMWVKGQNFWHWKTKKRTIVSKFLQIV